MKTFKDCSGQEWNISVTTAAVKRVRSLLDVDLMEIAEFSPGSDAKNSLLLRLSSDIMLLCDVLYAICKPQCDERDISDEQFGEGLAGDAIDQAAAAFRDEVVAFFPEARREPLRKILKKLEAVEKESANHVATMTDRLLSSSKVDQAIKDQIARSERKIEANFEKEMAKLLADQEEPVNS